MSAESKSTTPTTTPTLGALLDSLRSQLAPPAELLTRETLAALLDLGVSTFDRLREAGVIGPRPVRLGGGLRWHREEVLAWLRCRRADGELHTTETWPAAWDVQRRGVK